jgi:diadenosine tetraphosphate (Ap4A) HIT family hydrolase
MTSLADLIADTWFPFAGDITVKPLDAPVVPEPDRHGLTPQTCHSCRRPDEDYVWTDATWRLVPYSPTQVRGIVLLETREHLDSFSDMSTALLGALGPMIARVEAALLGLDDVARVHACRWGDGGAHFHLWLIPRPLGALQLRGSMLPMWRDLVPHVDASVADAAFAQIAAAMAADGGTAHRPRAASFDA